VPTGGGLEGTGCLFAGIAVAGICASYRQGAKV
jgi:hypothetical protein